MTTRRQLQKTPQGKHRPYLVRMGGLETWFRNIPYGTPRQFYRFDVEATRQQWDAALREHFAPQLVELSQS